MPPEYPAHWEADVVLRDGYTCHVRPITPEDAPGLVTFHGQLSAETIYFRFFAPYPELTDRDVQRFTTVDYDDRVALVATEAGELIAVARYDRLDSRDAEVAFVVRDDHQGRGLGAVLLEHLAAAAWERGVRRFVAEVLPSNRKMLMTFREAGYVVSSRMEDGVFHLTFDLEPTELVLSVRAAREHRSEARSVERLLNPAGVAVIGASRTPGRIGHELLRHLRDYGLTGPLYAIHPEADEILGVPAFRHIVDLPQAVDLAVVAVPAESVLGVVQECAETEVGGLVVVSSGFSDTATDAGRARQRDLVRTAREAGMRVVGPNCLGIINTDPRVQLNATLSPLVPRRGRVGLFCQSGALGVTVLETVARRGLGLSSFVSAGNRADVSANDLLQYWEADEATSLILLYLESIGNPRKFTRITRRLSRSKPVVAVRSGRYSQALPLGHHVRRTTLPPAAVDAVFEQSGVVQTGSLGELFDVAAVLAYQPLPRGDRVAVLGTSNALEILAADAVESARLTVSYGQPSLAQSAGAEEIGAALRAASEHQGSDAVLFVHIPSVGADQAEVHAAITAVSIDATKPLLAVMPAADGTGLIPAGMGLLPLAGADGRPERGSVPTFSNVEDAVRALALVRGYARWRQTEHTEAAEFPDVDPERARTLVTGWLRAAGEDVTGALVGESEPGVPDPTAPGVDLEADQVRELLDCYGIRVWPCRPVGSEEQAVAAAGELGYPVVLKTTAPWLAHRVDLGSVRLNLESERAVRTAYLSMVAQLDEMAGKRLVVQAQAAPGVACVLGAVDDPLFGPVVRFGIGGVASELLGDHAYRIPPLSLEEARRLVTTPKAAPLLRGYRGSDPVDIDALCELIARLGLLIDEVPAIASLDMNPIVVSGGGAVVLGASARVRMQWERLDVGVRRLLDA
ncbi:MAG: GNAT family N-acetyltransferase [Candidatus Nanopelagicales bacterium]|nr:GNAT family N-acetyltransferase [Candidatus Nanopelagicales bacterium]